VSRSQPTENFVQVYFGATPARVQSVLPIRD
jgi:hypothetical protein